MVHIRYHTSKQVRRFRLVLPTDLNYRCSYAWVCGINQNGGSTSLDGTCSGPPMSDIWRISPIPSDATQLLQVSASNGTGAVMEGPALLRGR